MLGRIRSKLLCDKRSKRSKLKPTSSPDRKPDNGQPDNGRRPSPPTASPEAPPVEKSPDPVPSESSARDLWKEALENLPAGTRKKLESSGLGDIKSESMRSQIDDLVNVAKDKQEECEKKFWKVNVNGNEIVLRDYATKIIGWVQQTGDIAVQFAPPQASLPWSVIKSVLQITVIEDEQMGALLASVEKIVRIINRGQVYELVYTPDTTPDDALKNFYAALVTLYGTALTLLADSTALFEAGTAKRTIKAIFNPGEFTGTFSDITTQEYDLANEVQACESRRGALADDRLMDTLKAIDAPLARVDDNVRGLLEYVNDTSRMEMFEWISPIQYGENHNEKRKKRTPDTGDWLLRASKFRNWEDASSSAILWLQGSQRFGIHSERRRIRVLHCDRIDKPRTQSLSILQSYVRQLSSRVRDPEHVQSKLWSTYREARENASNLSFDVCKEQLLESFNLYPKTTLVLDALDECGLESRADIIETLTLLMEQSRRPLKIFISSRPDPDIEELLSTSTQVNIQADDNKDDIKRFLHEEVERLARRRPKVFRPLQSEINDTLLARCEGMFQWVALQIQEIGRCSTPEAVSVRLQTLPKDLKTTYDRIYSEIEALEEHEKDLANRALLWVLTAFKSLNTDELLSAIRIELKEDELQFSREIDESVLMSICKNLLAFDTQLEVWRFPHLSVAEYLEKKDYFSLQKAHGLHASICLSLLASAYEKCDPEDESGFPELPDKILDINQPFQNYARHHWLLHVQSASGTTDSAVASHLKRFLGSPNESTLQYQRWRRHCVKDEWIKRPSTSFLNEDIARVELSPEENALFAMCRFSLHTILEDWWKGAEMDLTVVNEKSQSPLSIAATVGCKPICKSILDRGYTVDTPISHIHYGSALAAAAYSGQAEIVKFLVKEAGADPNLKLENGSHGTALVAAIAEGHLGIVKFLVKEANADPKKLVSQGYYTSPLGAAVYKGHLEITKFLVQEGADVNLRQMTGRNPVYVYRDEWRDSILAIAAGWDHLEIVKFLVLEANADVNMVLHGEQAGSAVTASMGIHSRSDDVFKFLVGEGKADPNLLLGGPYGNALIKAAYWGNVENVKYLVEKGNADVNLLLQAGIHGSALAAAASAGSVEVVDYLVREAKADVNMPLPCADGINSGGSALAVAASKGKIDVVKYLVKEHADVNMQLPHRIHGSVLAAAVGTEAYEKMEVVKYLVEEAGADINMQIENGYFGSALECAVYCASGTEETETATYLLGKGADINTPGQNGDFGGALIAATAGGTIDPVKLILEAGAHPNDRVQGGKYGSPLAATSYWGLQDSAELLIKGGADVNLSLENKPFGNALQAIYVEFSDEDFELPKAAGTFMALLMLDKEGVEELLIQNGADNTDPEYLRRKSKMENGE
ncbi:hypothetical protein FQN54_001776 [Arachnomyces sp. PD_36]|nr:hypothetical protein FQN54_001776 [Arachnomyces sp. PD_36]